MGIRTIVAIGLGVIAITAPASALTNSWTSGETDYWDNGGNWSLNAAPTNTDTADFITNATSKAALIDFVDTSSNPETLTISNLTVAGFAGATNTLSLTDMNDGALIPLNILNRLTFGNGGLLLIDNSMLQTLNGTFTSGSILQFALGTNFSPVVVSNNLVLAGTLNVTDGGGFTNTTYTLFKYFGTLSYAGLIVGSTPSNSTCVVSTNTVGQVKLVVTPGAPPSPLPFQIISVVRNTNDITVTWTTSDAGTDYVQAGNGDPNGSYDTNNFQDIGTVSVGAGTTNSYTDLGGATNKPSRFYRIHYSY